MQSIERAILSVFFFGFICIHAPSAYAGLTTEFNDRFSELGLAIRSFQEEWLASRCVTNLPQSKKSGFSNLSQDDLAEAFSKEPVGPLLMQGTLPGEASINKKNNKDDISNRQRGYSGYRVQYSLHQIQNSDDLYSSMGLSVASRLKADGVFTGEGPVQGGAKIQFASGKVFNKNRSYMLVKVKVQGPTIALSTEHGISLAPNVRQQPGESVGEFLTRFLSDCGDMYLHSYVLGGEFYGLIETTKTIKGRRKKRSQEFAIDLSALAKGKGNASQQLEKTLVEKMVGEVKQIWMLQTGGNSADARPIQDLQELCARAVEFPVTVDRAPIPMEARYQDYTEILRTGLLDPYSPEANEVVIKFGTNQRMMKYLGQGMSRLTQYKRELGKAVDADLIEGSVDPKKIAEAYAFHEYTEERMISFFRGCYLDYLKCDVASFVKELRGAVIKVSSDFNIKPRQRREIVLDDSPFCKAPLSLQDALQHREKLEKLAVPTTGIWNRGRCFTLLSGKKPVANPSEDVSIGWTPEKCADLGKKSVLLLQDQGFQIKCQKRSRKCSVPCWK